MYKKIIPAFKALVSC